MLGAKVAPAITPGGDEIAQQRNTLCALTNEDQGERWPSGTPAPKSSSQLKPPKELYKISAQTTPKSSSLRSTPPTTCFRDSLTPEGFMSATSDFQEVWDFVLLACMGYVVFITPYEVAFLGSPSLVDFVFWVNRLIDLIFLVDLGLQFFIVPPHLEPLLEARFTGGQVHLPTSSFFIEDDKVFAKRLKQKIRENYMHGWFVFDVIALLPYDALGFCFDEDGESANTIRLLRIVRLLRLGKVLRVVKASKLVQRYDDRVGISYVKFRLTMNFFLMVVLNHWSACIFRIVVFIEGSEDANWILSYFGRPAEDVEPLTLYNIALYFAVETISSVGYGDILPQTNAEAAVFTCIMILGACSLAFVLGSITSMITSMDLQTTEYYTIRAELDEFVTSAMIPPRLRQKLRSFFRNQHESGRSYDYSKVLGSLTTELREEVAGSIQSQCLNASPFFQDCNATALAHIASVLQQRSLGKGEMLISKGDMADSLFMIRKGLCVSDGRIVGVGKMVGEVNSLYNSICLSSNLIDGSVVRRICYTLVYTTLKI